MNIQWVIQINEGGEWFDDSDNLGTYDDRESAVKALLEERENWPRMAFRLVKRVEIVEDV